MTERRWVKKEWIVRVAYRGTTDRGFRHNDKMIEQVMRRPMDGSGYDFTNHERDLDFYFKMERFAREAAERVNKIDGLTATVRER